MRTTLQDGKVTVTRELGRGGMASVHACYDHVLHVWRAVKFLLPEHAQRESVRQRFLAEAQAMARLQHPHILQVYDVGEEDGLPYIVMALARGGSLESYLQRYDRMQPRLATRVMIEVCDGLQAAHDAGIVHRDIKPDNVLISRSGRCRITDFGIARMESEGSRTRTGSTMGTLGYMAPEQLKDTKNVTVAADIYALGATLYSLVTGEIPSGLHMAPLHPELLASLPAPLRGIVEKATSFKPEDRYPSASALAEALQQAEEQLAPDEDPPSLVHLLDDGTPAPPERAPSLSPTTDREQSLTTLLPPEASEPSLNDGETLYETEPQTPAHPEPLAEPPVHEDVEHVPDEPVEPSPPEAPPPSPSRRPAVPRPRRAWPPVVQRLLPYLPAMLLFGGIAAVTVLTVVGGTYALGSSGLRDARGDAQHAVTQLVAAIEADQALLDELDAAGGDTRAARAELGRLPSATDRHGCGRRFVSAVAAEQARLGAVGTRSAKKRLEATRPRLERLEQALREADGAAEAWERAAETTPGRLVCTIAPTSCPSASD